MKKSRLARLVLVVLVVSGAALYGARFVHPVKDIPAGTGYAALELCTRTYQSGGDFERIKRLYTTPKVQPLPKFWQIDAVPRVSVTVRTWVPTLEHARTAIFRSGLGCTVVPPDTTLAAVTSQNFHVVAEREREPGEVSPAWPLGDGAAETQLATAHDREVIARDAAIIFGEPSSDPMQQRNANVLLVARGGHLIHEQYRAGFTHDMPQLGWSMTKTLTALIVGLLATDHKLTVDEPVGLSQWAGTPKAKITWRQLLNMAPGLAWFEGYGGASDATEMLFSRADQGRWAADRPLVEAPGSRFTYSTGFTNIAMLAARERLGGDAQAIYDYYQARLFTPLGIRHGVIEPDASGTPVGGARGILRPVDWLRIGQLIADRGAWGDKQVVAPEFIDFMEAASPADAGYGGFLWRQPSSMIAPTVRARLPNDLVWLAGHQGQFVIIVPSAQLLVLRMGVSQGKDDGRDEALSLAADLLGS